MKSVSVAELKSRLSAYLNEVRTGEEILVRDRQTPIARIVPVTRSAAADDDEKLHRLAEQGKVRTGEPIDDTFWNLPAPRVRAASVKRARARAR
jgi:prevent-host-death family protein